MTHVLVTIDTETPQTSLLAGAVKKPLFKAEFNGEDWGIAKILKICSMFGCRPTSFVNIYETALWGDSVVSELLEQIKSADGDAELHTHPCWMFDARRENMWEYSLSEQRAIISKGMELFAQLGGPRPVAHRAGGYGINHDTFRALAESGVLCDCSVLHGHSNCRGSTTINKPVSLDGVIELPVTVFRNRRNRLLRADPERLCASTMTGLIQSATTAGLSLITIILHSYSLINKYWDTRKAGPNPEVAASLESVLRSVSVADDARFVSMPEILNDESLRAEIMSGTDVVPEVDDNAAALSGMKRLWRYRGLISQRLSCTMKGRR